MNIDRVQDHVQRGIGRAAGLLGNACDAYRPAGTDDPLALRHRYLRLPAAFYPSDGRAGEGHWSGLFDSAYTRVGDYIRRETGEAATWFVAAQPSLLPVPCIRTNHVVWLSRPAAAVAPGANAYGGNGDTAIALLSAWPASVLGAQAEAGLHVLLPLLPVALRPGDLLRDEGGRRGVVTAAQSSERGWKLLLRQVAG